MIKFLNISLVLCNTVDTCAGSERIQSLWRKLKG